ncbi:hypothetical protein V8D89_005628 [Ganoderma adspersum]
MSESTFAGAGSLYLAGFAQAGQPHAAIVLAVSSKEGNMAHITTKSGNWAYNFQAQKIEQSISLTSLIEIRSASKGALSAETLSDLLAQVVVPAGNVGGECLNWVIDAVKLLAKNGIVSLRSADLLREEFSTFCAGNRSFATSSKYPNMKVSDYCS